MSFYITRNGKHIELSPLEMMKATIHFQKHDLYKTFEQDFIDDMCDYLSKIFTTENMDDVEKATVYNIIYDVVMDRNKLHNMAKLYAEDEITNSIEELSKQYDILDEIKHTINTTFGNEE